MLNVIRTLGKCLLVKISKGILKYFVFLFREILLNYSPHFACKSECATASEDSNSSYLAHGSPNQKVEDMAFYAILEYADSPHSEHFQL